MYLNNIDWHREILMNLIKGFSMQGRWDKIQNWEGKARQHIVKMEIQKQRDKERNKEDRRDNGREYKIWDGDREKEIK